MADTMQFDLVSPERALASLKATAVQIPGSEGDMTAMPMHAPTITTLRPGVRTVTSADGTQDYYVTGGFAEIGAEATTVLAERAYPSDHEGKRAIEAHLEEARAAAEEAHPDHKDTADKLVADFVHLLDTMT